MADRVAGDVFLNVDPVAVDGIVADYHKGDLSEGAALARLKAMQSTVTGHLIGFDRERVPEEWNEIARAIENSERRYLSKAKQQFLIGTFSLPIAIVVILMSLLLGWQESTGASVAAGLIGAGLASLAAHAFFVLRVHQQASTAAERLAEKRLALLFLKLALGSGGDERKSLLDAGTSMFLGHQAPETLPLSPQDLKLLTEKKT